MSVIAKSFNLFHRKFTFWIIVKKSIMNQLYIFIKNFRVALILFVLLSSSYSQAATKTWIATGTGDWESSGNWSPSGQPAANDDVIIPLYASASNYIYDVQDITLNSLTFTGTGYCWLRAENSGNTLLLRNSMLVPSSSTVTIGTSGERLVMTLSTTCSGTLSGYMAYDAGNTNRIFTINGTLTVNSGGLLYDPNPSGGSDLRVTSTGMIRTEKPGGLTTTAASGVSSIVYSVTVCFGGSYTYSTGSSYEYFGTADQITGAGLSQNTPSRLIINKSAGTLSLTSAATISGTLTMTQGNMYLNSTTLTLGTSAAAAGTLVRSSGFLYDGVFSRWFPTTAVTVPATSGLFPLGTNQGHYRPLWFGSSSNLTTAGQLNVRHNYTYPATNATVAYTDASWGNDVQGVSNSYWTITRTSLSINGSTGVLRYGGEGYGTNNLTDLNASLASSAVGTHGAATNVNTTYEVNRSALSNANVSNSWYIGTKNRNASALPVELYDFNGTPVAGTVKLTWLTASEKNADQFEVIRTTDGKNLTTIGTVKAQGDSRSKVEYRFIDEQPYNGLNYYRLKQCDFDGVCKDYPWIAVQAGQEGSSEISLVPNPADNHVVFKTSGFDPASVQHITIQSIRGNTVYESNQLPEELNVNELPSGVYVVTAQLLEGTVISKLVVSH